MDEYDVKAIQSARDLLVQRLKEEKWCEARQVGQALEILVGLKGPAGVPGRIWNLLSTSRQLWRQP